MDEQVKSAFSKVKFEINTLNQEMSILRVELNSVKEELVNVCEILLNLSKKIESSSKKLILDNPTHKTINPTQINQNPTHTFPLKSLRAKNQPLSTGNEGVPTDRQTDQQTDNPTHNKTLLTPLFPMKPLYNSFENNEKTSKNPETTSFNPEIRQTPRNTFQIRGPITNNAPESSIDNAAKVLDSLDSLKKEIRLKFKRLTPQEMIVFSTIYQVEEETGDTDYRSLAIRLGLTESSIRDYVGRIIGKGIPVDKNKINNKTIKLSIPLNLKKIASLPTIIQLRDL